MLAALHRRSTEHISDDVDRPGAAVVKGDVAAGTDTADHMIRHVLAGHEVEVGGERERVAAAYTERYPGWVGPATVTLSATAEAESARPRDR